MTDATITGAPRRGGWTRPLQPNEFEWTDERIELLTAMYGSGFTQDYIAVTLGTTRGGVAGKISRLKLPLTRGRQVAQPGTRSPRATPSAPVAPPIVTLPEGRITLLELSDEVCHFPAGDGPFLFCGEPKTHGSYCPSCTAIAYRGHGDFRERKSFRMPI